MTHMRQMLMVAVVALLVPVAAAAVTVHVPADQPTIQQGIDAAAAGDTVLVAPDTYTGPLNRDLNFGGTNVVVASEAGSGTTVIDCESLGYGFYFSSGEDTTAVVRGFTIANAVADTGAGACCRNGSTPRFEECVFLSCTAHVYGGGLCCWASSPIVRNCEFTMNSVEGVTRPVEYGGGVACLSGASPLIVNTSFTENYAYGGGGLYSYNSSPQLVGCEFLRNSVAEYGQGGGARVNNSSGTTLTGCVFTENGGTNVSGAGMNITSSTLVIADCGFYGNSGGAAGGVRMGFESTSTVTGCTFIGNIGTWSAAGGIECWSGATPTITNCTFVGNNKYHVWCEGASPTIEYCILALSAGGPPVNCDSGTETPSIHHCLVFGNAGGDSLCGGNYSDIEYSDPLFCDVDNGDITLCADSPCLPGATWVLGVGAEGEGCPECGSPVERSTWGRIKATFRQ